MSLETEDHALDQPANENNIVERKLKITYTRDFLLSLSELDICKKLPSGFDQSLLSEFHDAPQERQKIGSLSAHSFRRIEYGSSPPTRGGIHGRWDNRSTGRSDRDSDSQSDKDSDNARRYGNQSRRPWLAPEHDGLLGSGSFTRPSGYGAGPSAPKFRSNDHFQLNKTNEPYHPPRPYKAVPHSRRETHDSYNDETFGSLECTSEDRAEEEKKRRASFELMRKEQQKAMQEKLNSGPLVRKDEFDITTLMDDSKDDGGTSNKSDQYNEPVKLPASSNDSDTSIPPAQTLASRPLVPPGFANASVEKNTGVKTAIQPPSFEVGNPGVEGGILHAKDNCLLKLTSDNQKHSVEQIDLGHQRVSTEPQVSVGIRNDKVINPTLDLDISDKTVVADPHLYKSSSLLKVFEASKKSEGVEFDADKVADDNTVAKSGLDKSSSLLDKLFDSALTVNSTGASSLVEHQDGKVDEAWSPHGVQSSKFAHWFLEEEKKPVDGPSSERANDLLSLIVGGEKSGHQVSKVNASMCIMSDLPSQSLQPADGHLASNVTSEKSVRSCDSNINDTKLEAAPAVLTCEDLEQSILSNSSESDAKPGQSGHVWNAAAKAEEKKAKIDDHASQHLLSLLQKGALQKGAFLKDVARSPSPDNELPYDLRAAEVAKTGTPVHDSTDANPQIAPSAGKSLTLETLFGTAFMKELQTVGAQTSAQNHNSARGDALESHDCLLPKKEIGSSSIGIESILASRSGEQVRSNKVKEHLFGFDERQNLVDPSRHPTELQSKLSGFDGSVNVPLPEEDNLITLGDAMKQLGHSYNTELFASQDAPVDITEKLAAANPAFGNERLISEHQESSRFLRGPYNVMREHDMSRRGPHVQSSSQQLQPPQLNHAGQLLHPLNPLSASINPQMKLMPEGIIRHDTPSAHQFPANMLRPPLHHPSTGLNGMDAPAHHLQMLQQMHMQGALPPPHMLRGFPSGVPPHSSNQVTGFMQDVHPVQGLPFGHQQPNFSGLGLAPPGSEVGGASNNPEMLRRLIEMELRSNPKQTHPLANAATHQGMYNHELDMGFRYR